jgi:hypothetical protein
MQRLFLVVLLATAVALAWLPARAKETEDKGPRHTVGGAAVVP